MNIRLSILVAITVLLYQSFAWGRSDIAEFVQQYNDQWLKNYYDDKSNYEIEEILELLDLSQSGLKHVHSAFKKKDWKSAKTELFQYYKEKFSEISLQPADTHDNQIADDAVEHIITAKNFKPTFRGKDFDWTSNAVIDGKEVHKKEWMFQFHRLSWWQSLSRVYAETKDEKFFNKWIYDMVTHYRAFPDLQKAPWAVRRGMESFYRTKMYLYAIPYMIHSEQFTEEHLLFFLGTFHRTTEHLRTHYAEKGNHLVSELGQVLENAVQMSEFKKATEWKAEAMSRLPEQLKLCIHDDGMNREYVFSYHTFYIELFTKFYQIVQKYGLEDELPTDFSEILENMYQVYIDFTLPDFTVPQFGDAWKYRKFVNGVPESRYGYLLATYSQQYPDNELLNYFAKKFAGEEVEEPEVRNAYYPESGFCAMRSGWDEDSVVMAVKNTAGDEIWHNQPDSGTFLLYGHGRNFMNDSGCFIYGSSDPEDQAWREFFRKTHNHQTLTLNNKDSASKPLFTEFVEKDRYSRLRTRNQSYDDLVHERTIWFVDQSFFIILDKAIGSAKGDVRVHFQLNPAPVIIDTNNLTVRTNYPDDNNLIVQSYDTEDRTPVLNTQDGWISYFMGLKEPRTAWNYLVDKKDDKTISFLSSLTLTQENIQPKSVFIEGNFVVIALKNEVIKLPL